MQAGTVSIKNIFDQNKRYVVPMFQRPYVWTHDDQWEPLWEDVKWLTERKANGQEGRPHFLGAIVLEQIPNRTGTVETRLIIDGQQRLTTIQILLEAFCDFCG